MPAQTLTRNQRGKSVEVCRDDKTNANRHTQGKFCHSRVLTGWRFWSRHHTYRRKRKSRVGVNGFGSDGGWQELSWEHNRDYRQSKPVMGPSSLSPAISLEALDISLPSIAGFQAFSIKLTLNWLTGTHTNVSTLVWMWEREEKLRNTVLGSTGKKGICSFIHQFLLISVYFRALYVRINLISHHSTFSCLGHKIIWEVLNKSKNNLSSAEATVKNRMQSDIQAIHSAIWGHFTAQVISGTTKNGLPFAG